MKRFKELNTVRKELIQHKTLFDEKGRSISFHTQKVLKQGKKQIIINLEYFDYGIYKDNKEQILNHVWFTPSDIKKQQEKKEKQPQLQLRKVG